MQTSINYNRTQNKKWKTKITEVLSKALRKVCVGCRGSTESERKADHKPSFILQPMTPWHWLREAIFFSCHVFTITWHYHLDDDLRAHENTGSSVRCLAQYSAQGGYRMMLGWGLWEWTTTVHNAVKNYNRGLTMALCRYSLLYLGAHPPPTPEKEISFPV